MSIPEHIFYSLKAFKPKLKLTVGNLVYAVDDLKQKKLMVIINFIVDNKFEEKDYLCVGITSQGKIRYKEFNEKELIKTEL